jgi:hypothetical protein
MDIEKQDCCSRINDYKLYQQLGSGRHSDVFFGKLERKGYIIKIYKNESSFLDITKEM